LTKTALDHALDFASQGCYVFPIKAGWKGGGKGSPADVYPLGSWADNCSADPEQIRQWAKQFPGCNWGCNCRKSSLLVIDADNKEGQEGLESWKKLKAAIQADPQDLATLVCETPGKGVHLVYRSPLARNYKSIKSNGFPDLDVIGAGYFVLPGSSTKEVYQDGKLIQAEGTYRVRQGASIAQAPKAMTDWLEGFKAAEPLTVGLNPEDLDKPHHFKSVQEYLERAPIAIAHGGEGQGDDLFYEVCCEVKDLGLTPPSCEYMVAKYYAPRCAPEPDESYIEKKVASAYRNGQNAPGCKTPEARLKQAREDYNLVKKEAQKSLTLSAPKFHLEYTGTPPIRPWLVPNWLPEGEVSSIYGGGSMGKSLVALQLAYAVATGTPWLGLPTKQAPVLYVACEDTDDELHRRRDAILDSPEFQFCGDLSKALLYLWSRVGEENDLAIEKDADVISGRFEPVLRAALEKYNLRGALLILDTVSDVYLGCENQREKVNKFIKTILGKLRQDFDLTILILAHPSRSGQKTKDMLSGSTAWNNAVRNRLAMCRDEDNPDVTILERVKSNYAKSGEQIYLEWEDGRFKTVKSPPSGKSARRCALLEGLVRHGGSGAHSLNSLAGKMAEDYALTLLVEGKKDKKTALRRMVESLLETPQPFDTTLIELREIPHGKLKKKEVVFSTVAELQKEVQLCK